MSTKIISGLLAVLGGAAFLYECALDNTKAEIKLREKKLEHDKYLNDHPNDLYEELVETQRDNDNLNRQISAYGRTVNSLNSDKRVLENKNSTLRAEKEQLAKELAELESKVQKMEEDPNYSEKAELAKIYAEFCKGNPSLTEIATFKEMFLK